MSQIRRTPARGWHWLVLACALAGSAALQAQQTRDPAPAGDIVGVGNFAHIVADLDRSVGFYRDVLGLPIQFLDEYRAGERPFVSARIGNQLLDLVPDPTYDPDDGRNKGGFLHFCVGVDVGALARIIPWLKEQGVTVIEDQPMPRMGATGMGLSIYISDPDGYIVELKEQGS